MPTPSYDARHRVSRRAPARPRRLLVGLLLPAAAAAAVAFGTTGAEMASSSQAGTIGHKAGAGSVQQAAASSAQIRDRRDTAAQAAQTAEVLRADAAETAARSVERKDLATRALEAKRAARQLAQAHGWQMPIKNAVESSSFGMRWGHLHAGEDFAVQVGTDLVSMSKGTVVFAGQQSGFGNLVEIRYWDGTISYFGHMSRVSVTAGEQLAPGQVVGQSGNTGHSTGPHLHLEIHPGGGQPVDPQPWLANHRL